MKPSAEIAERALLASLIYEPDGLHAVAEIVLPDDFLSHRHRIVYEAMLEMDADGQGIDLTGVTAHLEGKLQPYDIATIAAELPNFANLSAYAERVHEAATLRRLQVSAATIISACKDPDADAADVLANAETALHALTDRQVGTRWTHIGEYAAANVSGIKAAIAGTGSFLHAIPTGFKHIDKFIHGFRPGELCYLAARPSQGKTALAANIAYNQARAGHAVGILSIEMTGDSLVLRMQSLMANIALYRLRSCAVNDEMGALEDTTREANRLPLYIDDGSRLKPAEMRAKIRRLRKEHGAEVIFVDYIGLMLDDEDERKAYERVSAISRSLKKMAKEMKIPIVALAQLRRPPSGAKPQRPELSDLRDSGNLEADADLVIFIHREEQYLLDKCPDDKRGKAEIIVAKQRNGPVGVARLAYMADYCRFADLEQRAIPAYYAGSGRDAAAGE